ncbi:MAG TPA: transcription antitermination factor NusB [Thermoanaerobaculia bacterium]|nr:transcription antitermination factor NusB [Thermoanaerobaculia bacterium]
MAVGKRRTAREMAVQMLYQCDLGGSAPAQVFASFDLALYLAQETAREKKKAGQRAGASEAERADYARRRKRVEDAFRYAQALVDGTVENREQIDGLIRGQADNWRLERMPAVDRNILRLAVYEMLFETDIPKLVVVDEAIELAKKFGSEQSGRFVNGLLDGLLKQHTFPGSLT